ncbi:unnamed protein product [Boreogadus saida]
MAVAIGEKVEVATQRCSGSTLWLTAMVFGDVEEEKSKREELEKILEENNRKIADAQAKLAEEQLRIVEEQRKIHEERIEAGAGPAAAAERGAEDDPRKGQVQAQTLLQSQSHGMRDPERETDCSSSTASPRAPPPGCSSPCCLYPSTSSCSSLQLHSSHPPPILNARFVFGSAQGRAGDSRGGGRRSCVSTP